MSRLSACLLYGSREFSPRRRVAHPRGLDHRLIIAHDVHQADESIVQDGELLPPQLLDLLGVG